MGRTEAAAWWADVEHLRDGYERTDEARRRADIAERRASRERPQSDRDQPVEARGAGAPGRDAPRQPLAPRRGPHTKGSAVPARRTIEIRGRTVPAPSVPSTAEIDRRRPPRRAIERASTRPDRLAMWALLMGIVLILVAVGTADASVLPR
jgi:hypothetical protein